jgi:hypothetical protein
MPDSPADFDVREKYSINVVMKSGFLLKKEDIRWFIELAPVPWLKNIGEVVVHDSISDRILISFYRPDHILGIHIPISYAGSKDTLFNDIAVTVQAISDHGFIPNTLPESRIREYAKFWQMILTPVCSKGGKLYPTWCHLAQAAVCRRLNGHSFD